MYTVPTRSSEESRIELASVKKKLESGTPIQAKDFDDLSSSLTEILISGGGIGKTLPGGPASW